ncbi:hypothetical protein [Sinorhizobium meliloti]|uniref:hypothetical protein n=1 Tax=Rhizobium meliloti TaxID=382 RepID=UPI000B49CFC1|nr:hypothetical protein [Sinorhizobium meliloti]ASP68631.1 hypothetical protein CDO29_29975 [Sinorhizobium meliloti]MQX01387.1 hypothetical protein [Sinorhizobium meliloti]RVG05659.1 hypothetical protein CN234_24065 [Sinorhizobium meliloti]RVK44209.1 hypothetical protein CN160_27335 [Sinorhizobium meliloti]
MRFGNTILYAIAFCLSFEPSVAQNKAGTEKIARHKDIAKLMSSLHNWGVDREVTRQIDALQPKIIQDLEFAGTGGVLVVARFEKVQTDSGTYRRLISNKLDYVGIGATDIDAEIAGSANSGRNNIPYQIADGFKLDMKESNAYWFSEDSSGELTMREKPLELLRNEVINEMVQRKRQKFDWNAARSAELTRLSKVMTEKVGRDKVDSTTSELLDSREIALSDKSAIDRELKAQLERARKAADLETAIMAVGFIGSSLSAVNELAEDPSPPGGGNMTKEEALSRLNEVQQNADARAGALQKKLDTASKKIQALDTSLELILKSRQVPTNNLPNETEISHP